jgi:hypothetical protein
MKKSGSGASRLSVNGVGLRDRSLGLGPEAGAADRPPPPWTRLPPSLAHVSRAPTPRGCPEKL